MHTKQVVIYDRSIKKKKKKGYVFVPTTRVHPVRTSKVRNRYTLMNQYGIISIIIHSFMIHSFIIVVDYYVSYFVHVFSID